MDGPQTVTIAWEADYSLPYILIPLSIVILILIIVGIYLLFRRFRPRPATYPALAPQPPPPVFPGPIPQQHTTVVMISDKGSQTPHPATTREQLLEKFAELLDVYEREIRASLGAPKSPKIKPTPDKTALASGSETTAVEDRKMKGISGSGICGVSTKKLLRTVTGKWRQLSSSVVNLPADEETGRQRTSLSVVWARDIFLEWEILNCKLPVGHKGDHQGDTHVVYSPLNTITINQSYDQNEPLQPPSKHYTDGMAKVEIDKNSILSDSELPIQTI